MKTNSRRSLHGAVVGLFATTWLHAPDCPRVAVASEPVQARLRLLTHNIYGLDEAYCDKRASAAGEIIANATPAYDIVGLQEYYHNVFEVCGSGYLSEAIWCTGRYTNPNQYYRFYPEASFFDGGIAVFTMGPIQEFDAWPWDHQTIPEAVQGVILARVQIPGTPVTIDAYVLHLHAARDDCDRCCRKQELQELADIIAEQSSCSGNPVIVMGDFNIGGPPTCCGNQGYEDVLNALGNPRDLWWEANLCGTPPRLHCGDPNAPCDQPEPACFPGECTIPPPPVPEVNVCDAAPFQCNQVNCPIEPADPSCSAWAGYTNDSCLNGLSDGRDRIDFIFAVTHPALTSSLYTIELVDARVADWTAGNDPESGDPLQVSDHLGVEATIDIVGKPVVWVDASQPGPGTGTPCDPFTTVGAGVTAVPIGGRVLIGPGLYPDALTVAKATSLEAFGGIVRIGS